MAPLGDIYVENAGKSYKVETIEGFRKFREFATAPNGWKEHYAMANPTLKVESRVDDKTKLTVFRIYREMPTVDPSALYNNFHDADYRKTWDTNMLEGYNICRLNAHNDMGYYQAKLPWPLSNRDFCNIRAWMEFTNGEYCIFNHSEPHTECPERKKVVRAISHLTGYYVRPMPGGGCTLIYITHSDMCGSIPKSVTDMVLNQKVPELMNNIESCALKYVPWAEKQYPAGHVHSWTTPKMDWDCTTMPYPKEPEPEAPQVPSAPQIAPAAATGDVLAYPVAMKREVTVPKPKPPPAPLPEFIGEIYVENSGTKYKVETIVGFRKFREFATAPNGWKEHYAMANPTLKVESRVDDKTKLTVFRIYREMPTVDPSALYNNFHDADYRKTWDTNMLEGYNICRLNAHNDMGYYQAKLPWPLSNRDFCNIRAWMEFTNGEYCIFNHSEPHTECPERKKVVRAISHLTGYYVRPMPGGGCTLIYITHSDMCGSIPKSVTDMVLNQKVPELMNNIESCALKYVPWAEKQYPAGHVHSWTTPKMDWDCKTMPYPQEERQGAEYQALQAPLDGGADAEDPMLRGSMANSVLNRASFIGGGGGGDASPSTEALEKEVAELRRKLLLANTAGGGGSGGTISLAPVAPTQSDDTPDVQRFRAIMNDTANSIDRSFVQEGRMPTTREYLIRLQAALEGMRKTMPAH